MLRAESTCFVHTATSGATKELPAPVSSPACGFAEAEPEIHATVSPAAARAPQSARVFLIKVPPLFLFTRPAWIRAQACRPSAAGWADGRWRSGDKRVTGTQANAVAK